MQLTEEQNMIRDMVDDFGKKELLEKGYPDLERKAEFPKFLPKRLAELGILGMSFPEEYGGMDADTIATSIVAERLAFYWPSAQLIWTASHGLAGFPIMTFGSKFQNEKYLPRLASGEILGCYALTEPGVGSDAANIKTTAERKSVNGKNYWVINGTKTFITNADEASVCVLFAKRGTESLTPQERRQLSRHKRITAFVFETAKPGLEAKGITVSPIAKWALRSSHFCEVVFEDFVIPEDCMLGGAEDGFKIAMETLNNGRINIAAQAVGIGNRALGEAVEYANRREVFGGKVIEKQGRSFPLAEVNTNLQGAWLTTLQASEVKDMGGDYKCLSAMAKLNATEAALRASEELIRTLGAVGITEESAAMQIHHDALATVIYEGTSDIQKVIIAKSF